MNVRAATLRKFLYQTVVTDAFIPRHRHVALVHLRQSVGTRTNGKIGRPTRGRLPSLQGEPPNYCADALNEPPITTRGSLKPRSKKGY
jgi:hypothetical protein